MNSHSFPTVFTPLAGRAWLLLLFLMMLLSGGSSSVVRAQDPLDVDKSLGTFLEDIEQEASNAWWNDDWKFRRKISINDMNLLGTPGRAIYLAEPEPLLLYNTGRALAGLADLRVIAANGTLLPCGVSHFGRDDGTSRIWFLPNLQEGQTRLEVTVYYGNAAAKPAFADMAVPEGGQGDAQFMRVGVEELRPGATPLAAIPGSFFANLIVAEAESFAPVAAGAALVKTAELAGASGEKFLTLADGAAGKTIAAHKTVQAPEAGTWFVHVRYKNPEAKRKAVGFKLLLGTKEFDCGTALDVGAAWSWQSVQADFPKGALRLGLQLSGGAAPDTILLTRDKQYRPDYRDINGPVWMRFKVANPSVSPFYVDLYNYHITTSVNGPQGKTTAYLFRDRNVAPKRTQYPTDNGGIIMTSEIPSYLKKLPDDPANLLKSNEWSPWGETLERGSYTWYSQVRFVAGTKSGGVNPQNLNVQSEFSTRPDITRIFHGTSALTGTRNSFNIHMPPRLDLATVRKDTVTFDEWALQRFELAKSLGFKGGEGPKQIVACTIANAQSSLEAERILTTLDWIGLNTVTLQGSGFDQEAVLRKSPVKGFWTYYRTEYMFSNHFYTIDPKAETVVSPTGLTEPKKDPRGRLPGMNHAQTVEKIVATATDKYYRDSASTAKKTMPWQFSNIRYNDLDDEIGPAISGREINGHPLFKGYFIEFLQARKLQPAFFGIKSWDELEAVDYSDLGKKEKRMEKLNDDAKAAEERLKQIEEGDIDADGKLLQGLDDPIKDNVKKQEERDRREKAGLRAYELAEPTTSEKRIFYWTQKFRSHYTALFYRHETAAVHRYFPAGVRTCANLQASPIQCGRMWEGGLNMWDLGRENAFSALQVEDWHTSPVNVSFGMNMARAAARKNKQPLASLMVLGKPAQRIVTNIAQGSRYLLFYLYGPVQGDPAFAEDPETLKQIGSTMRKLRRTEADILAAKNRPVDAAILVDNTSEINGQYFEYPFDHDRMAIYAALNDQQIPVDIVGAEEVLEDNALSRYKVLYVCDPHVLTSVQQKIKAWVAAGGTLWADYAAMARQEYDEPSTLLDEVFGLKSRGPVLPYTVKGYNGTLPAGITVKVPKGTLLAADAITDIRYSSLAKAGDGRPDYKLSSGKVLATFENGKPAIIHNKFGKGQAVLNGFLAGIAYGGQWHPQGYNFSRIAREAPATPLRAGLMTSIARAAGVRQHVKIAEPMFWATVHDGPGQTVVYLVNGARDVKAKPLEVVLNKAPKSAYRGNGQPVPFRMNGLRATFPLTMAANDCDILVFKY